MSCSPPLGSPLTHTRLRTPAATARVSGMCSVCTSDCDGTCEIGLSAVRGAEAVNPHAPDTQQFASEKTYPLDLSHFNINGRVFGVWGAPPDARKATFPEVDLQSRFGLQSRRPLSAPFLLPALAKLNWEDYFSGAALAGVVAVIGEDVVAKDKGLLMHAGRVRQAPLIAAMVEAFKRYDRGVGAIVLQANPDDEEKGVLEWAIEALGIRAVELKFGQAAKGIQGYSQVPRLEDARRFRDMGYLVLPDPTLPEVVERYQRGEGPVFQKIGKLPLWTEEHLVARVGELRRLGAEQICFKTGPFAPEDLVRILRIASEHGVDLVTLDGAGGGTGHSPVRMMHEWGLPPVELAVLVQRVLDAWRKEGRALPPIALAGGYALEDQVFKGLCLAAPHVSLIALGRASMTAAMVGARLGRSLKDGKGVPPAFERFGASREELFADQRLLRTWYGADAEQVPTGAVGVFSYLNRVSCGLRQLMALNRRFKLSELRREDLLPLTDTAAGISGIPSIMDRVGAAIEASRSL